jgi:hypothetical protein
MLLKLDKRELDSLRKEYPEFYINSWIAYDFIENIRRDSVTVSVRNFDGGYQSLIEGFKDPRRKELIEKINELKYEEVE